MSNPYLGTKLRDERIYQGPRYAVDDLPACVSPGNSGESPPDEELPRLMHGLFGEIQISEEAHERRQNPARFRSVNSLNGPAELFGQAAACFRVQSTFLAASAAL